MRRTVNKKLVLLGSAGVGKTAIVTQFTTGKYNEYSESTIGASFANQVISLQQEEILFKFQLWDTAGQERFHSLAPMYYRGADVALVVYDITARPSYEKAQQWVTELDKGTLVALIGNKSDMESSRAVPVAEATNYAADNGLFFFETSAKTSFNIRIVFETLAKHLVEKETKKVFAPNSNVNLNSSNNSSGGCCT